MRCHYMSDLHLESQSFDLLLPQGDVLVVAGDLLEARSLDPETGAPYCVQQRERVMRFIDQASMKFEHVLLVAGNHEHYDGIFENTCGLLRNHLPGVTVLNNETVEIGGIQFFGSTFWTDFDQGSQATLNAVRRRMGDYFFVKARTGRPAGLETCFEPEDALREHDTAWKALRQALSAHPAKKTVVITHHAPSRLGLNEQFRGNGLDAAFASDLDDDIAALENVPIWVHGHTHVVREYNVGNTRIVSNAYGYVAKERCVDDFKPAASFEVKGNLSFV